MCNLYVWRVCYVHIIAMMKYENRSFRTAFFNNKWSLYSRALGKIKLFVSARKFDPVSHILCDLHWLPVRQRITFKLCVLAYKCLHGMAPPYLTEFHVRTSSQASHPRLRYSSTNSLLVPRTRTCYGNRNIALASPAAWNDLPAELTDFSLSLSAFRKLLKTVLFNHGHWLLSTLAVVHNN